MNMRSILRISLWAAVLVLCCTTAKAQQDHQSVNVVILGDSITWIGGDNCNQAKGWNKWFVDKFKPASCRSYARSGATWTNTPSTTYNVTENTGTLSNNNVIYNQVNRLIEAGRNGTQVKPDLILIAAGTNDAWFVKHRPNVFSQTAAQAFADLDGFITDRNVSTIVSLASSVRYCCEMLMKNFPDAQIILLTPLQSTAASAENIRKVGDIIEESAHYLSAGCIRLDFEGSVYRAREAEGFRFTYDGTHTSEAGAKKNGYYIANKVSSLLQF